MHHLCLGEYSPKKDGKTKNIIMVIMFCVRVAGKDLTDSWILRLRKYMMRNAIQPLIKIQYVRIVFHFPDIGLFVISLTKLKQ